MADNDMRRPDDAVEIAAQAGPAPIFEAADALVGERLIDSYFDRAGTVRLTVMNLQDADTAAILAAARQLGIDDDDVHIEPSDPAVLDAWERLRHELDELHLAHPHILLRNPSTGTASFRPELGYTVPPGTWGLVAPLHLDDGRHLVSAPMQLTMTD